MIGRTSFCLGLGLGVAVAAGCVRRAAVREIPLASEPLVGVPVPPAEATGRSPTAAASSGEPSALTCDVPEPATRPPPDGLSGGELEPLCAPELMRAAAEADSRLRTSGTCDKADLEILAKAVGALTACAGALEPGRWVFPVAGVGLESVGGQGKGFIRSTHLPCYATAFPGHPAHDIFVDDPRHRSRDRQGREVLARAVEDGMVLVARGGWTPDDPGRGGNYVMLLLPARRLIAYYAHLETVLVRPGQRVRAGQSVGTVGRTGKNAWPARSPTHLHFGLWDAGTFVPTNSIALLRAAQREASSLEGSESRTNLQRP